MISAVIIGAWTAWYLGLRAGIVAAVATAAALLVAPFVPGATMTIYALVLAWCAALYFVFPRLRTKEIQGRHGDSLRLQALSTWRWVKKTLQR